MKERELRPGAGYFRQMALDLRVEEDEAGSLTALQGREGRENISPSPAEAALRSETARELVEREGKAGWMGDYFALRDAGWPWRVACYIAWASSPKIGREPKTIEDLARNVLGLSGPRQIHHWRETNPAIDEVVAVMQAAPLMEHRRDVFEALAAAASDPDHRNNPDRRLYVEMTGDFVPRSKVEVARGGADDLSGMSDDELDRVIRKKTTETRSAQSAEGEGLE